MNKIISFVVIFTFIQLSTSGQVKVRDFSTWTTVSIDYKIKNTPLLMNQMLRTVYTNHSTSLNEGLLVNELIYPLPNNGISLSTAYFIGSIKNAGILQAAEAAISYRAPYRSELSVKVSYDYFWFAQTKSRQVKLPDEEWLRIRFRYRPIINKKGDYINLSVRPYIRKSSIWWGENRTKLGYGVQISPKVLWEINYMNRWRKGKSSIIPDRWEHILDMELRFHI